MAEQATQEATTTEEKTVGQEVLEAIDATFDETFRKDVIAFFDGNRKASGKRVRASLMNFGKILKDMKNLITEKRAEIAASKEA